MQKYLLPLLETNVSLIKDTALGRYPCSGELKKVKKKSEHQLSRNAYKYESHWAKKSFQITLISYNTPTN